MTMVYYQIYLLQNFTDNINLLRELQQKIFKPKDVEFDPSIVIGHTVQIFQTQSRMQRI